MPICGFFREHPLITEGCPAGPSYALLSDSDEVCSVGPGGPESDVTFLGKIQAYERPAKCVALVPRPCPENPKVRITT